MGSFAGRVCLVRETGMGMTLCWGADCLDCVEPELRILRRTSSTFKRLKC
jgi:hypothetical protein